MTTETAIRPLVEMRDMNVTFGGVHAVEQVSIDLRAGEIHAIVGGNGAGKSTLIKTLSGAQRPDSGTIAIDNPRIARHTGSRPSTRHWRWPRTSTLPATCSLAAS
jgi:ABC-type sugar transport system ATPase subunit